MPRNPRPSPDQIDWDAVGRFLAGESSAAEVEAVSQWMAEHPEEAAALTAAHEAGGRTGVAGPGPVDVNAAWRKVSARLDESPATRPVPGVSRGRQALRKLDGFPARRSPFASPALRAAAAVALIASGALVWRATDGERTTATAVPARDFTTAPAQRDSIVLADGTGVLLGPGSSLRVDAGYGGNLRSVRLEGEALFDVRHDDTRPFVVHTSNAMIHDLGTTFTVRTTDGTSGMTNVAVTVGAVRIARVAPAADSGVILREGDRASIGMASIAVQRNVRLDDELAWTRGRLVFRDTPLSAVASALERWYGVRVELDPRLDDRTLTSSFEGEPLGQVLDVIRLAIDAPVRQTDGVIVIGAPANPANPPR